MKKIQISCYDCGNECVVQRVGDNKEPITYCPFCGAEIPDVTEDSRKRPLLNSFDALDEYEDEEDDS